MKKINQTLFDLLSILNDGQYHDGTTIGEQLNISRTAVWKMIKKLEDYAIAIDSVKGKGYCLKEPLYLLDENVIKKYLHHNNTTIAIFETIDSTNHYLKQHHDVHVCLAEQQTQGRGRLNRTWISPFGKNIYLSFAYNFKKDISELASLSLITSLAIQKTLLPWVKPHTPLIKWPNDILCDDEKLAGSLIEIQAESNGFCRAIIGIGINVNMLDMDEIEQAWTSIYKLTGNIVDRNSLVANLIDSLFESLICFENDGDEDFIRKWRECDYLKDQVITFNSGNQTITGIARGINAKGQLLIEDNQGNITTYSSGDASLLRKV